MDNKNFDKTGIVTDNSHRIQYNSSTEKHVLSIDQRLLNNEWCMCKMFENKMKNTVCTCYSVNIKTAKQLTQ